MLKNQKRYRWVAVLCIAIYSLSLMIPVNSFAEGGVEFKKILPKQQLWYFNEPQKAAVDNEGNLYVVEKKDSSNNRVLKITPNGDTIIIAEDGEGGFNSIAGVATDSEGYIYVSDTGNWTIQIFDTNGNYFDQIAGYKNTEGQDKNIIANEIKVKDNKIYFRDWSNIHVFNKDDASQGTSFGSDVINGDRISGFDVFKSEEQTCIYVSAYKQNGDTYSNNNVYKFVLNEEGEYIHKQTYDVSDGNQGNYTKGVVVDSEGYIYVLIVREDNGTFPSKIIKLDSEGTLVDSWECYGTGKGKVRKALGLAIDNNDNIYVVDGDTYIPCVQKFDSDGNYITFWGKSSDDDGMFFTPTGVVRDNEGNIYVVDSNNHRIQKFDSEGNYLLLWGSEGSEDGQFKNPRGIAVDDEGSIYVADTENRRIQKFDSGGTYLDSFGIGDGQFDKPYGIAVDNEGNIYVTDLFNFQMQKLDSSGEHVLSWGSRGSGNGQFDNHYGVAIDNEGNVYVADTWNNRIQKFNSGGTHLDSFGSEGSGDGQFNNPYGIAVDNEGNIYVADTYNSRIQKLNSEGNYLDSWGSEGSEEGEFDTPYGVSVDDMGNVYVVDKGNHRIQYLDATPPEVTFEPNGSIEYGSQYDVSVNVEDNPIGVGLPDECNFKYIWSTEEILESEAVEWDTAKTFDPKLMNIFTDADLSTGEYYLHVKVWDKNGNETVVVSQLFNIDKDEPEATFTPMEGLSGRKDYRVNIAVADNAVAVDTTKLKYQWVKEGNEPSEDSWNSWPEQDQEAVNILASETGANQNGSYYLYVDTCDVLGNEGIVKSGKFVIDEEAGSEAVTIVYTGIPNNSAGYNQEYDIDIQANITGSTTLYYQWTESPAQPETSSSEWTLTTGDIHYGQDVNGDKYLHVKAVIDGITYYETQQFLFDNVAPTIGFTPMTSSQPKQTVSTEVYIEDNIKGQPIKLYAQWKAKDELSEDKNQWNDTIVWSEDTDRVYQETVTKDSGEGEYILFTKAVDSAVNEAVYHSDTFLVDTIAPTGNIEIASSTTTKTVNVSMDVSDATSTADDIEYSYS